MGYLLAIETSGKFGSIALANSDDSARDKCATLDLPRTVGSAQSLAPTIALFLRDQKVEMEQIGCLALVNGPGSFTGLRVGIATAKSFAYAMRIPVIGMDTLEVLLRQTETLLSTMHSGGLPSRTHVLLDAYRGQLFVRSRDAVRGESESSIEDIVAFLNRCYSEDKDPRQHGLVGPGVERLNRFLDRELADEKLRDWVLQIPKFDDRAFEPHAKFVAKLGLEKWAREQCVDPITLLPQYFRGSAAEEKAKAV